MRVLLYCYEYPPLGGGVGTQIKYLLQEYKKIPGLEVDLVTRSIDGIYKVEKYSKRITFHWLPAYKKTGEGLHSQTPFDMAWYSLAAYIYTWKLLFQKKFDVTHFAAYPGAFVSWLFRWKWPYVVSLWGVEVPDYNPRFKKWYPYYKPFVRRIWYNSQRVISNSDGLGKLAKKSWPALDYLVIPNGVDTQSIQTKKETDKKKNFTITAGGTLLGKKKGLNYLIEGFAKLHREYSDIRLEFIGSGDEKEALSQLAEKLGVKKEVTFLGRKSSNWIHKNLGTYHVLCLPSINEGMSNAVLEGMAAGLPLILTKVGGTKELLKDNGLLVKKRNSQDIYRALKTIYEDSQLRKKMGKQSRKLAEAMSWERIASEYYQVYQNATHENS